MPAVPQVRRFPDGDSAACGPGTARDRTVSPSAAPTASQPPRFSDLRHLKRWGLRAWGPIAVVAVATPLILLALGAPAPTVLWIELCLAGLLGIAVAATLLGTRLPRND
jgi:hypothetical protein